jgi:hypothetical protein
VQKLGVSAEYFKAGHVDIVFLDHVIKLWHAVFEPCRFVLVYGVAQPFIKLCSFEFLFLASAISVLNQKF